MGVASENAQYVVLVGPPRRFEAIVYVTRLVVLCIVSNACFSRFGDLCAYSNDRTDYVHTG